MKIWSDSWINGERIPPKYAAGRKRPTCARVRWSASTRNGASGAAESTENDPSAWAAVTSASIAHGAMPRL